MGYSSGQPAPRSKNLDRASDSNFLTGERIRKLLRAKGWWQIDLAEQSGVHEAHISDLERGAREPGLQTLAKIAFALQISFSELLRGFRPCPRPPQPMRCDQPMLEDQLGCGRSKLNSCLIDGSRIGLRGILDPI